MNAETAEKDKNQTEQAQEETKAPEASAENQLINLRQNPLRLQIKILQRLVI